MGSNDRSGRPRRPHHRDLPPHVRPVALSHGVAVGDATADSAVVWTRTADPAVVHVAFAADRSTAPPKRATPQSTDPSTDNTARVRLDDLRPGSAYEYRVWALAGRGAADVFDPPADVTCGQFRTAPSPTTDAPVSFVWTGDTYGQGRAPPYQVPRHVAARDPDFFLYLGDTIYADSETPALPDGDPETVGDYRAKYREVRERGPNLRDLLGSTAVVPIWDDHEVRNDWAGGDPDDPAASLVPAARQAFREYWPVDDHPSVTGTDETRLYRSFRWGSALELFVLDARQYRDANDRPDGPDKTMLGDAQRRWLRAGLAATDATFAVVASSVSLTSPSSAPGARDSWADGDAETGFERELRDLVEFVRTDVDSTVVWLAGDRHFARVASLDPDRDGTPDCYEAMAGPIGAAPREPGDPDRTLCPTVHYEAGGKYELGEFYNFGEVSVAGDVLRIGISDKVGDRQCTVTIDADGDGWPTVDRPGDRSDDEPLATLRTTLDRSLDAVAEWLA